MIVLDLESKSRKSINTAVKDIKSLLKKNGVECFYTGDCVDAIIQKMIKNNSNEAQRNITLNSLLKIFELHEAIRKVSGDFIAIPKITSNIHQP